MGEEGGVGEEDPSTSVGMTEGMVGPAGILGIFEMTGGVGGAIGSSGGRPLDIGSVGAGMAAMGSGVGGGGGEEGIRGKPSPSVPMLLRGWLVSLFMCKQAYHSLYVKCGPSSIHQ